MQIPPHQQKKPSAAGHPSKGQRGWYKRLPLVPALWLAVAGMLCIRCTNTGSGTQAAKEPVTANAPTVAAPTPTVKATATNEGVNKNTPVKKEGSIAPDSAATTKKVITDDGAKTDTALVRRTKDLKHADELFKEEFYPTAREIYLKYVAYLDGKQLSNVGYIYGKDLDADANYTESLKYYRMAAEKGNSYGNYHIGLYYKDGKGVGKDYKEAMKYFRLAADQQNYDAMVWIGNLYASAWGVPKDNNEAFKWYAKAADGGSKEAFYDLGVFYELGLGVTKDVGMAINYYQKAAAAGDADAAKKLTGLKAK